MVKMVNAFEDMLSNVSSHKGSERGQGMNKIFSKLFTPHKKIMKYRAMEIIMQHVQKMV